MPAVSRKVHAIPTAASPGRPRTASPAFVWLVNKNLPILVAMTFAFSTMPAIAVDLANNLTETRNGNAQVSNTRFEAQSFATNATDFVIDSVTVSVQKDSAFSAGTLNLFFFDATGAGGTPGSSVQVNPIASVPAASLTTTIDANYTFSLLNYVLAPSTNYFVVLGGSDLTGADFFGWNFTNSTNGIGFPSSYSRSDDGGVNWRNVDLTQPQKMTVTAVPEPLTIGLGAVGAALLCWLGRRSRLKAA